VSSQLHPGFLSIELCADGKLCCATDRDAMDTFRAIVARDEKTERVLAVTEALIRMNPGHYSIWYVLS
jgi:hypothetical protein